MYYFRNQGMRIPPPQQSRMLESDQQDYNDGAARNVKKRKIQDVVATTFTGLSPSAPTALVATSMSKAPQLVWCCFLTDSQ